MSKSKSILRGKEFICSSKQIYNDYFPYCYALRHYDNDWSRPCTIEKFACVNRLGFIAFDAEVNLTGGDWQALTPQDRQVIVDVMDDHEGKVAYVDEQGNLSYKGEL